MPSRDRGKLTFLTRCRCHRYIILLVCICRRQPRRLQLLKQRFGPFQGLLKLLHLRPYPLMSSALCQPPLVHSRAYLELAAQRLSVDHTVRPALKL
eukprot:8445942-Pyramimonas_sp.AAC.1